MSKSNSQIHMHDHAEGRQKVHGSGGSLLASGSLLALQWACYAWAIQHTSLSHTLLFLSATPVLLAAYTWLRRQPISAGQAHVYSLAASYERSVTVASSARVGRSSEDPGGQMLHGLCSGELAGTALGIVGAGALASGAHSENKVWRCIGDSRSSWQRGKGD